MKKHSTVRNFRTVDTNGKTYNMAYYNLDMIISLGYRVRSQVATQFRCWATERLKKHSCKQLKKSIRLPRKRWNARNRVQPLAARGRNRMLLWTIQHKNAYENLLKTGKLRADEMYLFCEGDFRYAYEWLAEQMEKRIGPPPTGIRYPIWAWYQWEGVRKRLDMRSHRRWTEKGISIVLLTIDIPDDLLLLSDFDMWHCVLNNSYLPLSEEDEIKNPLTTEKLESWRNIFQIDVQTDYWNTPKSTQATFWELRKEWVLKIEHFISS